MSFKKILRQISFGLFASCVSLTTTEAALGPVAADVIVVIDESGSMSGEQRWVAEVMPLLEQNLQEYGVGSESQENLYGLIGFGNRSVVPRTLLLNGEPLGNDQAFVTAAGSLVVNGGTEDGWRGIEFALDEYPRRNGAAVNVILATDEDRDNTNSSITFDSVLNKLDANNALLNAVVNARIQCGDGTPALGMDSTGVGYVADGSGGLTTCEGATSTSGYGGTVAHYVELAVQNGGAVWDLNFLRSGGHYAESFTNALLSIKVDEILNQRPIGDLVAVAQAAPNPAVAGQSVVLDGTQSFHQLDGRQIVSWEWDLDNDGIYDVSGPIATTSFPALGQYPVALRVMDDSDVPLVDIANITVDINIPPLEPTANAGGPYLFCPQNTSWRLDGGQSVNPDDGMSEPGSPVDAITDYAWDLNNDLNYSDANGAVVNVTAQMQALGIGDHLVRLRVTDNTASAFPSSGSSDLLDISITQVSVRDQSDVLCNCLPDLAARPKATKVQLTWTDTNAYQYAVYRSQIEGGPYTEIAVTDNRYSTYLDLGLELDTTYYYVVAERGVNGRDICSSREIAVTPTARRIDARNLPPAFTSTPLTEATEHALYSYDAEAVDPNPRDSVTYSLAVAPTGMTIDSVTGLIQWTPINAQVGQHVITVQASDRQAAFGEQTYLVTVANQNQPPVITSAPVTTASENVSYGYVVQAVDPDIGDQLVFALNSAPAGMSIDAQTGVIAWTPNASQLGTQTVEVVVMDLAGAAANQSFSIEVVEQNLPPSITTIPDTQASEGLEYQYDVHAVDPNAGDTVTYTLGRFPENMVIEPLTGLITWTPRQDQIGVHDISVVVSDTGNASSTQSYQITVVERNVAPVITTVSLPNATEDVGYTASVSATDSNAGDTIDFSLESGPTGLVIDATTGQLNWLPLNNSVGNNSVVIRATDSGGLFSEVTLTITVLAVNDAPIINSTPITSAQSQNPYRYQVVAEDVDAGDTLGFTLTQAPQAMTISTNGLVEWMPPSNASATYPVEITVSDSVGASARQTYTLVVTNRDPQISSTPATRVTVSGIYHYQVTANDPDGDDLNFQLSNAPAGMVIDNNSGALQWQTQPGDQGVYNFNVIVEDGRGGSDSQAISLTVESQPNNAPTIQSSPVTQATEGQNYQYQIIATDADGDTLNYSLTTAPAGMSINASNGLVSWTPATIQLGGHGVTVQVDDGHGGTVTQSYTLTVDVAPNTAPTFTSTPLTTATVNEVYSYDVNAADVDGDTLNYTLTTAPAGMAINSASGVISWTPTSAQVGTQSVTVQVADGNGGTATQSFTIAVDTTPNTAPSITSTPVTTATEGVAYSYDVDATDTDGDTLSYSLTTAPAGMAINSASGVISWTPISAQVGTQSVTVQVADGNGGTATQSFTIAVDTTPNTAPSITSTPVTTATEGVAYSYDVDATDTDGDTLSYSLTTAPAGMTIDSVSGLIGWTPATAQVGSHAIEITVSDAHVTATQPFTLVVAEPSGTPPLVTLVSPADGDEITAPTSVVASIEDDDLIRWELWLLPSTETVVDLSQATLIASGTTPVTNQDIAEFDPTLLINGQHRLYLRAQDAGGNESQDTLVVQVTGDMKLGHFSITFKDLEVPLAGIPITITRTYDSRRRNQSLDFGRGWSVGYQDMFIQESRPAGFNWFLDSYQSGPLGILTTYCVRPYQDNIVTVTTPDGDVERFRAVASPECNEVVPFLDVEIVFEALDGTDSTLEALNGNFGRLVNQHLVDLGMPGTPLDISRYRLTTREGVSYELEQGEGIRTLTVPSGETLTFGDDGITHSNGAAVSFVRDVNGRIDRIEVPDGTNLQYTYDPSDDLVSFTDQAAAISTYAYINDHYLQDIYDARGVRAIRNLYNNNGRLIGQIDAEGNQINYAHDLIGRSQTVTDRRGNSRILVFNERGDIVAETNALGETHQRSYNAYGDELSHIDPLGNTTVSTYDNHGNQLSETDALGRTTTNIYSWYNQLENETAPDGRVTSFDYRNYIIIGGVRIDKKGPLVGLTDGLGQVTQIAYGASGYLPLQLTDAEGNLTQYAYDTQGRVIRETAPDGSVTEYSHDAMGRVLTETRTRTDNGATLTEVTRHGYDTAGRRISTTDPLGNVTRTEYDEAGQVTAEIDALGNRTEYVYDARGNQIETRYSNGVTETRSYDPENNLIAQTDRAGQTTRMVYDAANRLIQTIHPDATLADDSDNPRSQNEYDTTGRLIAETDPLGNRTQHSYNAVGQRTSTTDALGNVTRFEYDIHGNRTAMIDALNRRTEYRYDAADQLTEVRYADARTTQTAYDAVGRRTAETDQAALATQYTYDPQGHLTQVTDALAGATAYTYDEQGNKLTQTNAQSRTTSWTYDSVGRVLSRTLPLGQRETFAYDANSNLTSQVDFNGNTTTHQYDSNNRLTQSDHADGAIEVISYDATGNRSQIDVTRPDGSQESTLYSYTPNNRLETEVQPDGTVLTYQYDAAGNRTQVHISLTDGSARTTDYSYDSLNRLQTVTDATGITSYGYDAVGNRSSVSYPNGSSEVYQYNSLNRLTRKETFNGALVRAYDYTLHATGRRTDIEELSGRNTHYSYDDLYRLTGETITDSQNGNYSATYQYDAVGNRTYNTIDGVQTAYTYDDNDRLTQQGGTRYTYDDNGNTLTETIDTNTTTYGYNARNELISVVQGGNTTEYGYNPNGIRTSKQENGVTTSYVVDENRDYAQVLIEDDGTAQVSYTYGDDLISQDRGGETSFYHYDGLGSTRSLTDSLGNLTDTYDYGAFGEVLNQTGSTENDYRFAGEQFDSTLDQYYLRARYYDQSQGRFTQQDTWMGRNHDPITLHKYLYAHADPGNMIDPTGNFSMGSMMSAINVMGTLSTIATTTYDVFQIATGEKEFSARELGTAALLSRLPTKFVKHLLIKACKANSFDGDTLVSSEDGLIPISEVKIGGFVWAYDELTGGLSLQKVVHLIVGEGDKALVKITLINGEELLATSEHPFYLPSVKVWIVASELKKGDDLLDVNGQSIKITNVEAYQKVTKVYNLTVDKEHTYFVGESGVLNHNSSCFKLNSRIKENPRLVKAAEKAGKNQKAQKDIDDLTRKLSEGNMNPGKGTKPVGKGVSEARGEHGGRVYFRVIKGEIEILGKSDKANQPEVIKEILKTFK